MPIYISRGRFTSEAIKGMLAKPENRQEAVAKLFQSVGGKLIGWYLTFGRHDWLAIGEFPNEKAAASAILAAAAGRQSVGHRDNRRYDSGRCCGHLRVCRKGRERLSECRALVSSSETLRPRSKRMARARSFARLSITRCSLGDEGVTRSDVRLEHLTRHFPPDHVVKRLAHAVRRHEVSVPMLLPPPGRFSTTNGWPSRSDNHCPIKRAVRFRRDSKYYTSPDRYHYSGFTNLCISSSTAAKMARDRRSTWA